MNVTCSIIALMARFRFVWLIATMLSASGNATLMEQHRLAKYLERIAQQRIKLPITYKTFFGAKTIRGSHPRPGFRGVWVGVRSGKVVKPMLFQQFCLLSVPAYFLENRVLAPV